MRQRSDASCGALLVNVDRATGRIRVTAMIGFAVEVKHHKCDSEQRLENPFQEIQREVEYIKAVCLLACGKLLQERLWILRRCQLIKIMSLR
jgi:hypothetical protein